MGRGCQLSHQRTLQAAPLYSDLRLSWRRVNRRKDIKKHRGWGGGADANILNGSLLSWHSGRGAWGGTALTLKGWFQLYQLKKALKGGGTSGSEQGVIITPPKKVAPSVLFTTNLLIPRGSQVPPPSRTAARDTQPLPPSR